MSLLRRAVPAAATVIALLSGSAGAAAAQAPGEVELSTEVGTPEAPIPGFPTLVSVSVTNTAGEDATATGVVAELDLPAGVSLATDRDPLDSACTASSGGGGTTTVSCSVDSLGGNNGTGWGVWVVFATTGTYQFTADASADQPDADGDATSEADVEVVDEDADLRGVSSEITVAASSEVSVVHVFRNDGPTAFGDAQINGTFPSGATLVPGSFFFGWSAEETEDCTVTSSGFSCGPVSGSSAGGVIDAATIQYRVVAPATPGVVAATATLTGREDPDHTNDTSTFRIAVRAAAADLYVPDGIGVDTWLGQETHPVAVNVVNFGELAAVDVAVTLQVPPGWTVGLPTDPDPADRSCAVAPGGGSVTCTFDELGAGGDFRSYSAPVTSPQGPTATGDATVTATSPTPDAGQWQNSTTDQLVHIGGVDPVVAVSPSTGLQDGDAVQTEVTAYPPLYGGTLLVCDGTVPLTLDHCDPETAVGFFSDTAGAASVGRTVQRYLLTVDGVVDCAVEACVMAVSYPGFSVAATTPLGFAGGPPPSSGLGVTIGRADVSEDPRGRATLSTTLTCAAAGDVRVDFALYQSPSVGGTTPRWWSTVTVPCTPGTPLAVTSDYMGFFGAGPGEVIIRAVAGSARAVAVGDVVVETAASGVAILLARLADPADVTVIPELIAALLFRLQYNPQWAEAFWAAILAPGS